MAKKTNKTEDQFAQVEEALTKTEQYIEDNQKNLVRIIGVIVGTYSSIFVATPILNYTNVSQKTVLREEDKKN